MAALESFKADKAMSQGNAPLPKPLLAPLSALQRLLEHFEGKGVVDTLTIRLPTPEDLIIMKAVAHRPKDLLDIQGIIQVNPGLERQRIQDWVSEFAALLEMPELWEDIADWF